MFVPDSLSDHPIYTASSAYQLREFTSQKRYESSEITAETVTADSPLRAEVEAFIARVFLQNYQATITSFLPKLIALRDTNGVLMAAFGLMNAANRTLFLEQYIDIPVEQLIYKRLGILIPREKITYIGNLAVANPRNAGILMKQVIEHSLELQLPWGVATMHHSLQNGLIKAGRDLYALDDATPERLSPEEQLRWGRYYHRTPQIVAIRGVDDTPVMTRFSTYDTESKL